MARNECYESVASKQGRKPQFDLTAPSIETQTNVAYDGIPAKSQRSDTQAYVYETIADVKEPNRDYYNSRCLQRGPIEL